MTNGWLEGKRGYYRLGELLTRDGHCEVYLASESTLEDQERYLATFVVLVRFNPLLENPTEPVLSSYLTPGLPYPQPWSFLITYKYKVCLAASPPGADLYPRVRDSNERLKALVKTLPRELVGPKTRRKLILADSGVVLHYEAEIPVGACFEVYVVGLKPPKPPRVGNFSPVVRLALLEAAGYKCQECGSPERLEVDHIEPLWQGGEPTFENGQVLCQTCHLRKSKSEGSLDI